MRLQCEQLSRQVGAPLSASARWPVLTLRKMRPAAAKLAVERHGCTLVTAEGVEPEVPSYGLDMPCPVLKQPTPLPGAGACERDRGAW